MTFCFLTPSATGQLLRVSDPQAANLTTVSGDIRWSVANDTGKGATHVVFYWEDGAGNPGVWHPGYLHEGWYDASVWHPGYYEYVWHEGWWENTTWHEGWFEPVWHGGYFEEVWRSPHYEDVYHGGWNEDVWHEGYTVEVYHDAGWYGSLWHEAWTESIWHEGYSEQVWRDAYTEEVFHEGHWDQTWHEPYYEYVLFGDYYEDVYHEGYWNQLWHDGYWENTTWHDAYGEYISHDGWYEQVQHEGYWEQTDVWHPDYEDEDGAWHAGYWEQVWHEPYTTQLWHEPYSDYVWHEAYWDRVWHDSYWENTTYNDGYTEHVWHGPHYENVLRDGYWENTTWHNAETEYIYHPEGFQDVWHDGYTDEVYHDGYWDDYAWHDAYTEYVIHEGYNSQIWHDAYYEQVLRDGYTEQVWHPEYYEYIPHDGYWDQVWHESYTEAVWHEAYSEPGQWHPPYWVKGWWEGGSANLLTASAASDPGNGSVSVSLPSLWPGHTYNYFVKSVIAADTDNVFDASNDTPDSAATAPAGGGFFQFTTPSAPLISITDLHYENLTARGADIVWTVTNDSGHPATHALYYAADNPGANLNGPFLPINGSDGGTVRVGLSSLAPGSANFVVVQSTLTGIEGYDPAMLLAGGSLTVTTPSILRITNAPSRGVVDVASRSTTLNWGIENNSGQSVNNTVTYSWSGPAGSGSGQATAATAADQSQVSVTISNLQAGATYTFNASSSISSHEGDAAYSSSISSTFTVTAVEMPPTTAISIFNVSANPDLISDTMALVTWNVAYTNVNDYGTGSHFVLVSSNAPPTAVEQVLLAEGQEDSSGNVWAVLSGLSAGQTNYFSVQSILGPSTNRFAIDDNGGLYYSFTNTVTGQIPDDPWNETIAIVQPPVAGFVSDTNAVISWQVT
ncbi:MAG: hypothetical protein NTY01_15045, partial [Verrucomicrobia bacterium]|nr:hypothetical protein [Verrucomicrobiota bacterium]